MIRVLLSLSLSLVLSGCVDPPGDAILILDVAAENAGAEDLAGLRLEASDVELTLSDTADGPTRQVVLPRQASGPAAFEVSFDEGSPVLTTVRLFVPTGWLHQVRFITQGVVVRGPAAASGNALARVPSGPETGLKLHMENGPFDLVANHATRIATHIDVRRQLLRPPGQGFLFKPSLSAELVAPASSELPVIPGRIVVGIQPNTSPARVQTLIDAKGFTVLSEFPRDYYVLKVPDALTLEEALRYWFEQPEVAFVLPDTPVKLQQAAEVIPCDEGFQNPGSLTRMGVPRAWAASTGSPDFVLAVVDVGFDLSHPDLFENWFINVGELGRVPSIDLDMNGELSVAELQRLDVDGDQVITFRDLNDPRVVHPCGLGWAICDREGDQRITPLDLVDGKPGLFGLENGEDNDNNGFVDDLVGWNFGDETNLAHGRYASTKPEFEWHGTAVASVIGAVGAVGTPGPSCPSPGIAGLNWRTRLLPISFAISSGGTADSSARSDAYRALRYASLMRADVINASFGATVFHNKEASSPWPACAPPLFSGLPYKEYTALREMMSREIAALDLGVSVLVNAADNCGFGNDVAYWPGGFPHANKLLVTHAVGSSVAATRGPVVDLAAEGGALFVLHGDLPLATSQGTSIAAAMVTGTLGLVLDAAAKRGAPLPGGQPLIDRLLCNAAVVPDLDVEGHRFLDVGAAVTNAKACP